MRHKEQIIKLYDYLKKTYDIDELYLGTIVRSIHISSPLINLLLIAYAPFIISTFIVIYTFIVYALFIYFDGCFLSKLEKLFLKDDFNMVDCLLLLTKQPITHENRLKISYIAGPSYAFIVLAIYYYRFFM